ITRYSEVLLGDAGLADDATQNTFINVWKYAHTYSGRGAAGAWMFRIAYQQCVDILRRRTRNNETSIDSPGHEDGQTLLETLTTLPDSEHESLALFVDKLPQMLSSIDPKNAEAVQLRFLFGLSVAEVGLRQGVHKSVAVRRIQRGLQLLRRAFQVQCSVGFKKPARSVTDP